MDDIPPEVIQYTNQSISTIHHALRAPRRRLAIGLVAYRAINDVRGEATELGQDNQSRPSSLVVPVRQIAKEIVSIEEEVPLDHATGDMYHNVYTTLIQTHLPNLDDIGAVEYDSDRKTISPDYNLVALAAVAAISSPIARLLFHGAIADLYSDDTSGLQPSIDD